MLKEFLEATEVQQPAESNRIIDLPDDSGRFLQRSELPDDSGCRGLKLDLPDDSPINEELRNCERLRGCGESSSEAWLRLDIAEPSQNGGGSYKEVCKYVRENEHEDKEVHHMPADSVSPLDRMDGPCIEMDREDHRLTASCGNSRDAQEYRAAQKELIDEGKFDEALEMDIEDIHEKFGDKYDIQISEMQRYVEKLEEAGGL